MIYLYVSLIGIAAFALWVYLQDRFKKKEQLQELRNNWGKVKQEYFPFHQIEDYSKISDEKPFHELSDQTLNDIDFFELFRFIDRTTSKPGQQYLYSKLKRPSASVSELQALDRQAKFFSGNQALREEIQQNLLLLSQGAYQITALLRKKLIARPPWLKWLVLDTIIVCLLIALSPIYQVLLLVLLLPAVFNTILHYWNKQKADSFAKSFPQLSVLITIAEKLTKKELPQNKDGVHEAIAALKPFQSRLKLLSLGNDGTIRDDLSQIGSYFLDLIKAIFLIEVHTLYHLTGELETKQQHIRSLYRYVGNIDVAISVASLREGSAHTCQPEFISKSKAFSVSNIYHPLIKKCVTNSIHVHSKSVLITGSNMSGKTTFLRTLIVNSVLAQTIYTCFADEFKSPVLKQFSSIRIDDNLLEGTSYYFEEINIMASLINEASSGHQNLFISDEVFKGTNTIERIASAKAILSYLNQGDNIVFVSTHDVELSAMLASEYDLYHFTEVIENEQLHFDHRLRQGPLTTRNAIRLLELSDYPAEITSEATRISTQLSNRQ